MKTVNIGNEVCNELPKVVDGATSPVLYSTLLMENQPTDKAQNGN
ncbi:MAG: hypothetical protein R2784_02140 [Saprospiraceae bacterium]